MSNNKYFLRMERTVRVSLASSAILYHSTSIEGALSILQEKHFFLSLSSIAEDENQIVPNTYYLSMSRTLNNDFVKDNDFVHIVFELDGKQLGSKYKIVPLQWTWYSEQLSRLKYSEAEDRLLSSRPTLPIRYVKAIHCPIIIKGSNILLKPRSRIAMTVNRIHDIAIKLGIPIYFYQSTRIYSTNPKYRVHVPVQEVVYKQKPLKVSKLQADRALAVQELISIVTLSPYSIEKESIKKLNSIMNYSTPFKMLFVDHKRDIAPVVSYMRKLDWTIDQLRLYVLVKWSYIQTGKLRLHKMVAKKEKVQRYSATHDWIDTELYLLKEHNLDPSLLDTINRAGGTDQFLEDSE